MRIIENAALSLNARFRLVSHQLYFGAQGIDRPMLELTRRSPLKLLREEPKLAEGLDMFASLLTSPH